MSYECFETSIRDQWLSKRAALRMDRAAEKVANPLHAQKTSNGTYHLINQSLWSVGRSVGRVDRGKHQTNNGKNCEQQTESKKKPSSRCLFVVSYKFHQSSISLLQITSSHQFMTLPFQNHASWRWKKESAEGSQVLITNLTFQKSENFNHVE